MTPVDGHRFRLRQRFATDRSTFTDTDLLELLLTYAIPRQDVAPIAQSLIRQFGSLAKVIAAEPAALQETAGIGEHTATLLQLLAEIVKNVSGSTPFQPSLLDEPFVDLSDASVPSITHDEAGKDVDEQNDEVADGGLRAFVNDEVSHSQEYLPEAYRFQKLEDFHAYLCDRLPYNAATTRRRRANHIVNRFFPSGSFDGVLVDFLRQTRSEAGRDSAIFYGLLRSEPLLMKVAEELIWPALAAGRVTRGDMRTFILRYLPALTHSSQTNVLRSIVTAYSQLGVATLEKDALYVRQHPGDLDGFVYGLCVEYPQPGIYSFDSLARGLLRKGLLWDMAWMRQQLYLLHQVGIVAKVSEIDAVRQFTLSYDPVETLRAYFALNPQAIMVLRESSDVAGSDYSIDNQQDG
jgi:DNA repair protein RadC